MNTSNFVRSASALVLAAGIASPVWADEADCLTLDTGGAMARVGPQTRAPMLDREDLGMLGEPPTAPAGQQQPAFDEPGWRQQSWLMRPVNVEGQAHSGLREEDRIGSYGQPRWTATRRFPSTRVYVIPEGHVEVEAWARATVKRDHQGGETEWRFLQEVEIGLGHRFQLDLYLREDTDTASKDWLWGGQFEVRYALADWGQIWGNPTLYFEYLVLEDRPDKIEPKLLLGDEICERWHWAVNFVGEFELSGGKEHEYAATCGLSKTIVDECFSLGVECVFSATDVAGDRGHYNTSFVVGPSIQWHPCEGATINVAPLIGIGHESPAAQIYFNAGWEFH